ncbi:MAG TPA: O-antigen ligase family protein, partial [Acidimicrobiales bacterium]|nr:O-antigen ligase family protein [Acidimicrobiales bacterium]
HGVLTARGEHAGLLVMSVLVGLAVAAVGVPAIVLLLAAVAFGLLVDRYGARQLSLAFLVLAGFLGPMNALRLGANVTLTDLCLVLCAGLAIMARATSGAQPATRRRPVRPDVLAATLLIAGGIIGSQFAANLGVSLSSIIRFGLAAVGVPLVFAALGPTRAEVRLLAWAFVAGAAVNSVAGVLTYDPGNRGIGLSTHSNHLAAASLLASGFAAGLFLTASRRAAWTAAALWGIVAVGILKSGSRAGVIGEMILIALLLGLTGSGRILRWCVAVVVGVGVLLALNVIPYDEQDAIARVLGRNRAAVAASDFERAQFRAKAIQGIEEHPLTGAGFEEARTAHNVYLQVWGAAGIIGLLGMAVLWSAAVLGLVEGMGGDRWVLGAAAAVVSFLVIASASNILWDRYLWFAFALFVTGRMISREEPAPADVAPAVLSGAGVA